MLAPILATKLYIPVPRAKSVARRHLTALLDNGQDRKLILICAPAG